MSATQSVEQKALYQPPLGELCEVLEAGLKCNFGEVSVCVEDCPDLRKDPWTLEAEGICGKASLVDVGGVPNLIPLPDLTKVYNFDKVAEDIQLKDAFFLGAGAGSFKLTGTNCEMMANLRIGDDGKVGTRIAKVNPKDESCILEKVNHKEFCLLGNFLASKGKSGKVLKIKAKKRTGRENFVSCIRKCLSEKYREQPIGLGGVFLIKTGKAKLHIMPQFAKTPIQSDKEVEKWLNFYNMNAPLICLGVLISHDPDLDLRVEHTHCFSHHGEGGHYHEDTTPDDVEYEAYYSLAETIYRIDRPNKTHQIGRD